jgi:hypothetical protein
VSLCITEHHAVKAYGRVELQIHMFLFDRFLNRRPRDESLLIVLQPAFLGLQFLAFEVMYHVVVCSSVYRVWVRTRKEKIIL